jgi:riboflavin-specific deaminase-like protein
MAARTPKRPFVFSNLATSLDGKIASADRGHFYLGTPADRLQMQVLRRRADAILMGASTLRSFRGPLRIRGAKKHPLNIVLSSSLAGISPKWAFFTNGDTRKLLFATERAPAARRRAIAKVADLVVLDSRKPVAPQIVRALEARGVKRLLVEGGGSVMWDFVSAGLLDEVHVTLTPWILGGTEAPTLVDGPGFPAGKAAKLRLVRAKRLKNELYLTYRRA